MLNTKFALAQDGPNRIEIKWKRGILHHQANMTVLFDGLPVGHFETRDELLIGKTFSLPNGEDIHVVWNGRLQITHKGEILSDIVHPKKKLAKACDYFVVMGIVTLIFSVLLFTHVLDFDNNNVQITILGIGGVILVGLGQIAKRQIMAAVIAATLLWCILLFILIMVSFESKIMYIVYGGLVLGVIGQGHAGIKAIKQIKTVNLAAN
jgi:hypothetical protein